MKNKKGLSVIIGYVLLITFGIVLSIIVYSYLKSYVPSQSLSCPSGVSIFLKSYTCNSTTGAMNLTLENNGRFTMQGYIIYGATSSGSAQNYSLSKYFVPGKSGGGLYAANRIYFNQTAPTVGGLQPGGEVNNYFQLDKKVYSVRILPIRVETVGSTQKTVSCGSAQITENLVCSS